MSANKQNRRRGTDPAFPRLLGDRLCLDFVNTIESPRHRPEDHVRAYPDLVRWGRHVGILAGADVDHLLREAAHNPGEAAAVFGRALALRESLTRIFRAIARGGSPDEADLERLRTEYVGTLAHARLTPADDAFGWAWGGDDAALDRSLWAVAHSAVRVLTEDELTRIKECPGAGDCGWLFYDSSKNGTRRWCSMEGCGSRVKMRRLYARRRSPGPETIG